MKKWFEPLGTAWVGVVTHKLRSFLTILGIVIGVGAVISLMSIGKGAQKEILSRLSSLGSDLISVSPGSLTFGAGGNVRGVASAQTLSLEDANAIAQQVDYINRVAPTYSTRLQLVAGGENTNATVTGVPTDYFQVMNLAIANGSFFTDYENQVGAKVAVLGSSISQTLFGDADPVGQQIRMGNNIAMVIGVLESKGTGFSSPDEAVLIPLTAMQQIVSPRTAQGEHVISAIVLTVSDEKQIDTVTSEITSLLRTRHRLAASASNDFTVTSALELTETVTEATGMLTLLLGAIAAISLLVGGIGVMNIMLVSVLERTREIGIRKALGAKERDIWLQFLIEAAFLTLSGGIIGIAIGWVVAFFVARSGTIPAAVTPDIVILAVSVSVGIGLFFGFYPAWNASRLNPIDALRSE